MLNHAEFLSLLTLCAIQTSSIVTIRLECPGTTSTASSTVKRRVTPRATSFSAGIRQRWIFTIWFKVKTTLVAEWEVQVSKRIPLSSAKVLSLCANSARLPQPAHVQGGDTRQVNHYPTSNVKRKAELWWLNYRDKRRKYLLSTYFCLNDERRKVIQIQTMVELEKYSPGALFVQMRKGLNIKKGVSIVEGANCVKLGCRESFRNCN